MKNIDLDKFTVITVTFNSSHCIAALSKALKSLKNIIVVDNGSDDDVAKQLKQSLPQALLIENKKNIGFGAANNCALNIVTTPYALLLNPDCIPTTEFLTKILLATNNFPQAAIIAPHLVRKNGKPEISYRWPATKWKSKGPQAEGPCCVGFVCGAAMLLNMEVMKKVGFFDETFFLYYEDEDLCQRVFMHHKQIVLVPTIEITHLSRGSVKGPNPLKSEFIRGFHHAQSKLVFEHKHFGSVYATRLRWKTLGLALLTLLPRILFPQPRYLARLSGRIIGLCRSYPRSPEYLI
ncbi:MAG: glycosyltransferase family 2 protein [Burkholderiaceae bacterium]